MTLTRRLLAIAAFALAPALAQAQTAPLNAPVPSSAPSGYTLQPMQFNCNNAVPASGQCWPYLQIYDGTTKATVNADGGAAVHVNNSVTITNTAFGISGTLPAFASNPTIANTSFGISGTLPAFGSPPTIANSSFGIAGTLPAYAAIPAFKIDQTTPGTTNGVAITGTLPAFTANPTVKIDQTTPGTTNGVALNTWGGGTLAAPTAPGTPQTTGLVPTVNVGNSNANLTPADAVATATYAGASPTIGVSWLWNGTSYDRQKEGIGTGVTAVSLPTAQVTADPCSLNAKTNLAISTVATALNQIIAASGGNKIYICSLNIAASAATAFNLNSGTGTNCATGTAAVIGAITTATNGMSLAANGGLTLGNGAGTIAVTAVSAALCTFQSAAVTIAGNLTYVQAP